MASCSKEAKKTRFLAEADSYFKAGNYDKAKVSYLNVVRLDPQNALAFERIGAMWHDDAAPLQAGAFLAKASELDPKNAQNRVRLARCYLAIGRLADAKKEALKVLEQAPDNSDAISALASSESVKYRGSGKPDYFTTQRHRDVAGDLPDDLCDDLASLDDADEVAFGVLELADLDALHHRVGTHHPGAAEALRLRQRSLDVGHPEGREIFGSLVSG